MPQGEKQNKTASLRLAQGHRQFLVVPRSLQYADTFEDRWAGGLLMAHVEDECVVMDWPSPVQS